MTCNEVDSLITEYLEDAMPASARSDFEAHLSVCPECRGRLDETRALINASHSLQSRLSQDWQERTAGETAEQYIQKLEARLAGESRPAQKPYRRLIPAAAAVAAVVIAFGIWIHVQNAGKAAVPLNRTINLTQEGPVRGAEQPKETPVEFRQRILNLTILMPIGSEAGEYGVAIARNGKILAQATAPGTFKNGITTVHVRLDCRRFPRGPYEFLTRSDQSGWASFPMVIR